VTGPPRILEVAELDFTLDPEPWRFAETEREAIAQHWAEAILRKPATFNGRVLLLRRRESVRLHDGALRLQGAYLETDYASFLAWRDFGRPTEPGENCFSMAALRSADGAFLLGEMAPHTVNAGRIYFPSGTPDPSDVFDGKVDLDASARRELFEETGLHAEEAMIRSGWTVVLASRRVACMKAITLALAAEEAKARIDAFLARDPNSELTRMHIVRRPDDINRARTPDFVVAYLEAAFA
jgi:8-oxo-dGTP pyrophosphatase MutT (NUDIX family)